MPASAGGDDIFWMYDEYPSRRFSATTPLVVVALCLLAGAMSFSYLAYSHVHSRDAEVRALHGEVGSLEQRVAALGANSERITSQLKATDRSLKKKDAGVAPLAARVLHSVFRVQTSSGWLGTGWAAWTAAGQMYVVTANHVIEHERGDGVTLERGSGSWTGEVVGRDPQNDLALIRADGQPAGAAPLWESPTQLAKPRPGDMLLLAGSPYGLDGSVTTGIVSRVTSKAIQTDAAANPGNSGGPAVDREGHVVGVVLAHAGENLTFAIPIARVCDRLRAC